MKNMNKIDIYMITHKSVDYIPNGITPLFVGDGTNEDSYIRDNIGDNISNKNKNYCELTALYWMWKNSNADILGLCHYRRFFGKNEKDILGSHSEKIIKLLKKNDMIVSTKWITLKTVYDIYKRDHYASDLDEIENIIKEKYADYLDVYKHVMNGHYTYQCNMFICKKDILDSYCEWLFSILFELENRIDINNRNDYQKRVYGFISERLLTVWILKNKLNVHEYPLYLTEINRYYNIKKIIKKEIIKFVLLVGGQK